MVVGEPALVWAERAGLGECGALGCTPHEPGGCGPLRVNSSALEAAGQFTLLPGLYKNTSFEVLGEAVKGKTWWRIKPGVGLESTSLPGS